MTRSIGSSDIAQILGMGALPGAPKWLADKGPWAVYNRLVLGIEDKGDDGAREVGRVFEGAIRDWCKGQMDFSHVIRGGIEYPDPPIIGPEPWMHDRPDGEIWLADGDNSFRTGALEVKTCGFFDSDKWGPQGSDQVPPWYEVQCRWHMAVLDVDVCVLAVAALDQKGRGLRWYQIKRDHVFETDLVNAMREWFRVHIDGEQEPTVDSTRSCTHGINARWPEKPGKVWLDADDDDRILGRDYLDLKEEYEHLKGALDTVKNNLRARIGDAHGIKGIASNGTNKRGVRSLRVNYKGE